MTAKSDAVRVELRLRDFVPASVQQRQEEVYEQLVQLQEEGEIADVSVEDWGHHMRAGTHMNQTRTDSSSSEACSTYKEFEAWAERNGHNLEPAFSTHARGSLITDERKEVIRFPIMCLAVYDAEELLTVVPSSTNDGVCTVEDCIAGLQVGE